MMLKQLWYGFAVVSAFWAVIEIYTDRPHDALFSVAAGLMFLVLTRTEVLD